MNMQELLQQDFSNQDVAILGFAGSGKTYLSERLGDGHTLIHTDDHIGYPEDVLGICVNCFPFKHFLVEGIMCYELLEHPIFRPEIIIEVQAPRFQREWVYRNERDSGKLKYIRSFDRKCQSLFNYYLISPVNHPKIITVENHFDYVGKKQTV